MQAPHQTRCVPRSPHPRWGGLSGTFSPAHLPPVNNPFQQQNLPLALNELPDSALTTTTSTSSAEHETVAYMKDHLTLLTVCPTMHCPTHRFLKDHAYSRHVICYQYDSPATSTPHHESAELVCVTPTPTITMTFFSRHLQAFSLPTKPMTTPLHGHYPLRGCSACHIREAHHHKHNILGLSIRFLSRTAVKFVLTRSTTKYATYPQDPSPSLTSL